MDKLTVKLPTSHAKTPKSNKKKKRRTRASLDWDMLLYRYTFIYHVYLKSNTMPSKWISYDMNMYEVLIFVVWGLGSMHSIRWCSDWWKYFSLFTSPFGGIRKNRFAHPLKTLFWRGHQSLNIQLMLDLFSLRYVCTLKIWACFHISNAVCILLTHCMHCSDIQIWDKILLIILLP